MVSYHSLSPLELSELETFNPKYNHSVVATKDFVFITGGEYYKDNTFEVIVLSDTEEEQKLSKKNRAMIENEYREIKEEIKVDENDNNPCIFISKGSGLRYWRKEHASVVIKNYLYVLFGCVKNGDRDTMSFERIEIPPINMTRPSIDHFYSDRKWKHFKIDYKYEWKSYFSCSNCFVTNDNILICYGKKISKL